MKQLDNMPIAKIKLTPTGRPAETLKGKVAIRWRKTTATWVIYHRGRVVESGFHSSEEAQNFLEDFFAVTN